jgi:hypothetical protein
MRGAALPAALLFGALGLLLAFAPRRWLLPAVILAGVTALMACRLPIHGETIEVAFIGCWISVILLATAAHLPRIDWWLALIAALDAGLWSGAVIAGEGASDDLLRAMPALIVCLPAMLAVRLGWRIAVKVVASWLIAIALLAALLPTTATPGYMPDHME